MFGKWVFDSFGNLLISSTATSNKIIDENLFFVLSFLKIIYEIIKITISEEHLTNHVQQCIQSKNMLI